MLHEVQAALAVAINTLAVQFRSHRLADMTRSLASARHQTDNLQGEDGGSFLWAAILAEGAADWLMFEKIRNPP